ncbi:MAG: class I SAM-dependent methyltransferase, partial [Bacteroidota bacterium]
PQGTKQFVHYHCADMKKLPLPDNSADVVTVGKFFYLIPKDEYDNYMADVKRVLKNDGLLICEISNALHLFNPVTFLKTFFRRNFLGKKIMSYAYPWELSKLFIRFKLERITGIEFPFFLVNKMTGLNTMNRLPILRSFGGSFVVVYRLAK